MKLKKIANNVTLIVLTDGTEILISYKTPVAAYRGDIFYRTEKKWSATTTKHINSWLGCIEATERPQEFFDELLQITEK